MLIEFDVGWRVAGKTIPVILDPVKPQEVEDLLQPNPRRPESSLMSAAFCLASTGHVCFGDNYRMCHGDLNYGHPLATQKERVENLGKGKSLVYGEFKPLACGWLITHVGVQDMLALSDVNPSRCPDPARVLLFLQQWYYWARIAQNAPFIWPADAGWKAAYEHSLTLR